MSSNTLVIDRLALSKNELEIQSEKQEDVTQSLSQQPPDWSGCTKEHRPIGRVTEPWQESLSKDDGIARSTFIEPETFTPDFAHPKRVPGTDQNIYPRAPISSHFHERYLQLVDFFKQAVDTHKSLKHHTSKINYELRLCGNAPSEAVASIVVFCTAAIFKPLQSLLTSRHIRRQYQLEKASVQSKFLFASNRSSLQVSIPAMVPFKVVFWREANSPTQRRSATEQVVTHSHHFLTMCGSMVRYDDRLATLGLLISVDSKLYGLTVDHLFDKRMETRSMIESASGIPSEECDAEDDEFDKEWIDDVKYEDFDSDTNSNFSDDRSAASGSSVREVVIDQECAEHQEDTPINGHKLDPINVESTSKSYLDWALIEFDDGYFERPNAFYSEDDPTTPKFLSKIADTPTTDSTPVFMISGVSGTQKGVMLNSNSYIGGSPGENLCRTWNVILSSSAST